MKTIRKKEVIKHKQLIKHEQPTTNTLMNNKKADDNPIQPESIQ